MRVYVLILLAMFAALAAVAPAPAADRIYVSSEDLASEEGLRGLYERWHAVYRRGGDPGEKAKRFAVFANEAGAVHTLNEGGGRVKYHLNWFADLSQEEFGDKFAACSRSGAAPLGGDGEKLNRHAPSRYYPDNLPTTVDWRTVDGALTSVKQQGSECGSCYAFAAAGAIESVHFIENHIRINQMVDCSPENFRCNGGWAAKAFDYVTEEGIDTWERYPYVGNGSFCPAPEYLEPAMSIMSNYVVEPNDENLLMDAVSQQPVVVTLVSVNTTEFKYYAGGVYRGPCNVSGVHEALLVGYGTTPGDDPHDPAANYWLIKNSWGESWGEGGYMRLQRGYEADGGLCGVMSRSVYPSNAYAIDQ